MEGYKKLKISISLKSAVNKYGINSLHPLDRRLWKEVPSWHTKTALVSWIRKNAKNEL